ncbi:MAG TPA: response regulator transcription factor [Anaerolineae bacterium]|nr:response regulator transcription factor [Anaerolineae bacterium]HID84078.1 response regulator transcription factor [Anaerolineales bacterium]HIQ08329.1 response regulator transcription factor [Anaerolineaceae bacterium]
MKPKIRLLIVDDHEVVRLGLRMLLEAEEDMVVVGEAADGEEALRLASQLRPDVVVMDIRLPGRSGLEACQAIRQRHPKTRVIMLTSYLSEELVTQAIRAGASGYVLKNIDSMELVQAIRSAYAGRTVLDPSAADYIVSHLRQMEHREDTSPFDPLSQRELQVMALVARGKSNREIGRLLHLSEGTVRNYVSSVMEKLGLRNRIEVATFALEHRLFDYFPLLADLDKEAR